MKVALSIMLALLLCSCANNAVFMSQIHHDMGIGQARRVARSCGFGTGQTIAIYKGYTLFKFNKALAMPVFLVTDPSGKIVSMESASFGGKSEDDFHRAYLVDIADHIIRIKGEHEIRLK